MEVQVPTPQTTLLILLGASTWPFYPEFQSSQAFAKAAQRLKAYFLNPRPYGLPAENLLDLFNSDKSADELDVEISQFLERRLIDMRKEGNPARDLLLYFVGHGGFVGRDADFFLAIRRTRTDNPRVSGLQMMALADTLIERARYLRRIIILDCCFAAAAFSSFQAGPDQVALQKTVDAFEVMHKAVGVPTKGTTLLCSSSHKSPSLILSDGSSTMFTKSFLDALVRGTTSQRDRLTLREVKDEAANLLYEMRNAPKPVVLSPDQSEGDVADIPFFPNPWIEKEQLRKANEDRIRKADEEQARREEERIHQVEEEISQREARAGQVEQNRSKAEEENVEHVIGPRESRFNAQLFQEPKSQEKVETHKQVSLSSTPEQSKQTPIQQLPAPNLSSTPTRQSLMRNIFSTVGIIWVVIGCLMAITGLFSVGLRLFPAGVANIFIGLLIFFLARKRKSSLSIIGIFVGAVAILSGIVLIIIAGNFPNGIINEACCGLGNGGVESGTVTLIAGVIILGFCAFSMIRR